MFSAFLFSVRLYWQLCVQSLGRSPGLGTLSGRGRLLRLLIYLLFIPIFLLHWLGFLLDEIFFRGYRKIEISQPVFVLGVPRSGTTFLHRTLAADEQLFTTVSTWEVLLAPSITQRVFWRTLARIDKLIGRPFGCLVAYLEKRLFKGLEGIHDVSLHAAEEDYLLLLPLMSCFILFLPFTESSYIWNLSRLDWGMPDKDRQRILDFYKACLQKHLYFHNNHGNNKRFLSKNAAFASWILSLREYFPDAHFVICLREPDKAVPSLIGSLESGAQFFEIDLSNGSLPNQLVEMMQDYYRHLITNHQPEWEVVHMHELQAGINRRVGTIYQRFGLTLSEQYRQQLDILTAESTRYTSRTSPIDPAGGQADNFFTSRFPWYYELSGGNKLGDSIQP